MNDSTIIKPRPGAKQVPTSAPEAAAAPDQTVMADAASATPSYSRFKLPETSLGAVCDQASRLLSLAVRLLGAARVDDVADLRRQCMDLVREYQANLKAANLTPDTVETASYCVCALIDEIVLNSEWGQSGHWAAHSLLSEFHSQTWSGTHFFDLVAGARRTANTEVMMLQYLCLSLGFKGKYRVEERGQEELDTLRDCLYHEICAKHGRFATPFEKSWEQKIESGPGVTRGVPVWVGASVCAVVLLLFYLGFSHTLDSSSEPVLEAMNQLAIPAVQEPTGNANPNQANYLRRILQTEIDKGLVELDAEDNGRVTLRIGNESLFESGGSELREDTLPLMNKIARALESTEGSVMVTGHTDNQPISTSRYPSNWHLSLARATAVSDELAGAANLEGRLWPEGRGEAEPRFDNATAENRARNRRVEISLIP
ncbi:type VI secretion system protein TssL, long form [Marinobacter xestospongiae]|uniref:Type VI secretion system protein TssL, long form n=1 Tax=Marinobacter xestospongiae TaxID=994319 RepID=A0ABU3VY89_9GAMM|nr:type VI secretion system protein TssL, long form [Marinobacter xestospongiae]MDV2078932.1 type VI secretion system protein TssL, long form [Marinobacter xestospongiae]